MIIREANINDLEIYFNWANDSQSIKYSVSKRKIELNEHRIWFNNKLNSKNCILYIFEEESVPIGQVRFEIENKLATISYSVDKKFRGKGYGYEILENSIKNLFLIDRYFKIKAIVDITNDASIKIFRKLNFTKSENIFLNDSEYSVFFLP